MILNEDINIINHISKDNKYVFFLKRKYKFWFLKKKYKIVE